MYTWCILDKYYLIKVKLCIQDCSQDLYSTWPMLPFNRLFYFSCQSWWSATLTPSFAAAVSGNGDTNQFGRRLLAVEHLWSIYVKCKMNYIWINKMLIYTPANTLYYKDRSKAWDRRQQFTEFHIVQIDKNWIKIINLIKWCAYI